MAKIRTFETGATRNSLEGKLDYYGFLSPAVLRRFAQYMYKNRKQADGSLREPANWTKGIPKDAYIASLWRHVMELSLHHSGTEEADIEDVLSAIIFNASGYLYEQLQDRGAGGKRLGG